MEEQAASVTSINKPLISIGMPVYNGEKFIAQALDSMLSQDYGHFELIICNNASSDGTKNICLEYAARDNRIHFVENKENIGALNNFNKVLDLASGEYFMWAAYDDLWEPNFISTLLGLLETTQGTNLAFCYADRMNLNGEILRSHQGYGRLVNSNRIIRAHRFVWFPEDGGKAMPVFGLMRTRVAKKIGGIKLYNPVECTDDMFLFQMLLLGNFAIADKILFHKRDVPGSGTFVVWSFFDFFAYYGLYTRIALKSDLRIWEKMTLIASTISRQIYFVIRRLAYPVYRFTLRPLMKSVLSKHS